MTSAFAKYERQFYEYRYGGTMHIYSIAGGVPADPKLIESHLARKVSASDDLIRAEAAEIMIERGLELGQAIEEMSSVKGLVGFRQDPEQGLYIGGYQLKAALKEAASIAAAAGSLKKSGWGLTSHNKGILSWLSEHVFVEEPRLYLGVTEPAEVVQSFIAKVTPRGPVSAIQYTEVVRDADVTFTIETDWDFPEKDWAAIWLAGQKNGIGAARKMGYGTYEVTRWERL